MRGMAGTSGDAARIRSALRLVAHMSTAKCGDDAFRKFWSHFFSDTDCLLFLLDPGAGTAVVGEAAEEMGEDGLAQSRVNVVDAFVHECRGDHDVNPLMQLLYCINLQIVKLSRTKLLI